MPEFNLPNRQELALAARRSIAGPARIARIDVAK